MQPLLQAHNITVTYGQRTVVNNVDISVNAGELVALVGPNGSGKSTLLGALIGDIECTGQVLLGGQDIAQIPELEAARMRAVQLQENRVAFSFTAGEVVRLGRAAWAGTAEEARDDAVIYQVMSETEVAPLAQQNYQQLSGGEKARTTFARVIAQETVLVLMDEPTAAMDIRHQEYVLSQARSRADEGVGVLVVMHDLSVAAAYADRMVLLEEGAVAATGTATEVLTPQILSPVYGYQVHVIPDPFTGAPVVIPQRKQFHGSRPLAQQVLAQENR